MRKIAVLLCALSLTACGMGNVYDRPLPDHNDVDAMLDIKQGIKPEDQEAWSYIVMSIASPMTGALTSKTVGEAIEKQKARAACIARNDLDSVGEYPDDFMAPDYQERKNAHIEAYNKIVDALNACYKMEV